MNLSLISIICFLFFFLGFLLLIFLMHLLLLPQRSDVQLSGRVADNRADRPILWSDETRSLRRGASPVHAHLPRARLRVPRRDKVPAELRRISTGARTTPVSPRSVPDRLPHVDLLRSESCRLHGPARSPVPTADPGSSSSGGGATRRSNCRCECSPGSTPWRTCKELSAWR